MAFKKSIDQFKSVLNHGGLRPTMFQVELNPPLANWRRPTDRTNTDKFIFLCKAAQIPSSMLTTMTIGLPAGGALKLPSSRVFEPWTVKVINDDAMGIRGMIENWQNAMMGRAVQYSSAPVLSSFLGTATVYQLDRQANFVKGYQLNGLYPELASTQELSAETGDNISEFDITFQYQYWEPITNGSSYSPFNQLLNAIL